MVKYRRVSYEVRCQISALKQAEFSVPEIAKRLGYHKSTIYRELKRNERYVGTSMKKSYNALQANTMARERYRRCRRKTIITGRIELIVRSAFKDGWSPEQIAGRITKEKIRNMSHETVYRFAKNNPELLSNLKYYRRPGYGRYKQRMARPKWMINIRHRPNVANERKRIGDWERDTMYVKDRKTILVLTDRKTRFVKLQLLKTHTAKEVAIVTKQLIDETGKKAYTVTNDNGGEFRWNGQIGFKIFYCDPHHPQQRGTVENTIGLLRRYLKTTTDPDTINLKILENVINMRPRKILNYQTPHEVFFKTKVALAM